MIRESFRSTQCFNTNPGWGNVLGFIQRIVGKVVSPSKQFDSGRLWTTFVTDDQTDLSNLARPRKSRLSRDKFGAKTNQAVFLRRNALTPFLGSPAHCRTLQ